MVAAVTHLKVRSCLIDGEVICCDERGLARFEVLRRRRKPGAFSMPSTLLELAGTDLRREPLEVRKPRSRASCGRARHGVRLNEHLEHPCGLTVFQHACQRVRRDRRRLGSRYRSGRLPDWLEFENRAGPVRRAGEEGWG